MRAANRISMAAAFGVAGVLAAGCGATPSSVATDRTTPASVAAKVAPKAAGDASTSRAIECGGKTLPPGATDAADGREPALVDDVVSSPSAEPAIEPAVEPATGGTEYWTPERMAEANANGEPPGAMTPGSAVAPDALVSGGPVDPRNPVNPANPVDGLNPDDPLNPVDVAPEGPGAAGEPVPCVPPTGCAVPGGPPVTFADGSGCMPGNPGLVDPIPPGEPSSGSGGGTSGNVGAGPRPADGTPCVPTSSTSAPVGAGQQAVDCGGWVTQIPADWHDCVTAPASTAVPSGAGGGGEIVCDPVSAPTDPGVSPTPQTTFP